MNYPIHDKRRMHFNSPEGLKWSLKTFPLTKEFIDWVAKTGYRIRYEPILSEGSGFVTWESKSIYISPKGDECLINKVKVHELIHVSIPGMTPNYPPKNPFEIAIDEIADEYLDNIEFLNYIDEKIPLF